MALPEIFTVTAEEYEAVHSSWVKAIKVLPEHSVVCKQDWFTKDTYRADYGKGRLPVEELRAPLQ